MKVYKPIEVLVIEDNPDDSELTVHAIKRGNPKAHVIHKWNGLEALEFVSSSAHPFSLHLIMLNLGLPKIDGIEVLEKLRSMELTKATPVVILTASEEISKIIAAYRHGANSYVIKPTRFETYIDTVSSITYYWSSVNAWIR
jgi:two-component system response regulator